MNPLFRYLFKYFYSTQSLFQDIPYRNPNPSYFPSLNIILQLYNQYSTSLLASFYKNTTKYLWYFTSTFIAKLIYFFGTKAFLILVIIIIKIVYLGFLTSHANKVALIIWISKVLSKLQLFTVSYLFLGLILSIELVLNLDLSSLSILFIVGYQFFQYFLYNIFKLLFSTKRCNTQGQFIGFSGIFKSLVDVSGNLISVEFNKIFKYKVDISGNFKLVGLSRLSKFQFRV